MRRLYLHQLAIALDQLLNALLAGWADETLSSRAYRCRDVRRWRIVMRVIDGLFFWQDGHCKKAYEVELAQGHLPSDFRKEVRYAE